MIGPTTDARQTTYSGAALDSRQAGDGALFFAVPGEQTDGHRFVRAAFESGASAAVVHHEEVDAPEDSLLIRVDDTTEALHALTRAVRQQTPERLIGITGSAGKTTTKELLAAMLAERYRVAKSPGNLNNLYGFPLALLSIPADSEWMVAEMGMSTPDELAGVSRLATPDAVVLLNVGAAHLENFPSLRAIADAKAGVMAGLSADGLVIANADDPEVVAAIRRHRPESPTLWYSEREAGATTQGSPVPRVRARAIEPLASTENDDGEGQIGYRFLLALDDDGETVTQLVELPLHGRYNVSNCLAAAAAAWALGVSPAEIARAVLAARPPSGRGVVHRFEGRVTVIDDSYNSNPRALELALDSAAALASGLTNPSGKPRHWAVLGDMLELGPQAPELHRRRGAQAAKLGFAPLVAVGPLSEALLDGAREAGASAADCLHFTTAEEATVWATRQLQAGDVVLVKGSRGIGLETVVEALLERAEELAVAAGGEP